MFNELFNFSNKRDRNDFFISLLVILFFALLFFKIFFKGEEEILPLPVEDVVEVEIMADEDGDGIADENDNCPLLKGVASNNGCPTDSDGDGVYDTQDKCPNIAGLTEREGCPADSDGDGIHDLADKCPKLAGVSENNGCPADSDGDGVYDKDDKCPQRRGLVELNGCPEAKLKAEEKAVLVQAMKSIKFETGSANLKSSSISTLDKIYSIMSKYPAYKVSVSGHTDSKGDDDLNLELSKKRAAATADYLVNKGIRSTRIKSQGLGESQPIDSNDTNEGRENNRRVEFEFSY